MLAALPMHKRKLGTAARAITNWGTRACTAKPVSLSVDRTIQANNRQLKFAANFRQQ